MRRSRVHDEAALDAARDHIRQKTGFLSDPGLVTNSTDRRQSQRKPSSSTAPSPHGPSSSDTVSAVSSSQDCGARHQPEVSSDPRAQPHSLPTTSCSIAGLAGASSLQLNPQSTAGPRPTTHALHKPRQQLHLPAGWLHAQPSTAQSTQPYCQPPAVQEPLPCATSEPEHGGALTTLAPTPSITTTRPSMDRSTWQAATGAATLPAPAAAFPSAAAPAATASLINAPTSCREQQHFSFKPLSGFTPPAAGISSSDDDEPGTQGEREPGGVAAALPSLVKEQQPEQQQLPNSWSQAALAWILSAGIKQGTGQQAAELGAEQARKAAGDPGPRSSHAGSADPGMPLGLPTQLPDRSAVPGQRRRHCKHEGCSKQAKLSSEGVFLYCKGHMAQYGLRSHSNCKRCAVEGCERFAKKSAADGSWTFCRSHLRALAAWRVTAPPAPQEPDATAGRGVGQAAEAAAGGQPTPEALGAAGRGLGQATEAAAAAPPPPPSGQKLRREQCEVAGCRKNAARSQSGCLRFCKAHMKEHGLLPLDSHSKCQQPGCQHYAKASTEGVWKYCKAHMKQYGMRPRDYVYARTTRSSSNLAQPPPPPPPLASCSTASAPGLLGSTAAAAAAAAEAPTSAPYPTRAPATQLKLPATVGTVDMSSQFGSMSWTDACSLRPPMGALSEEDIELLLGYKTQQQQQQQQIGGANPATTAQLQQQPCSSSLPASFLSSPLAGPRAVRHPALPGMQGVSQHASQPCMLGMLDPDPDRQQRSLRQQLSLPHACMHMELRDADDSFAMFGLDAALLPRLDHHQQQQAIGLCSGLEAQASGTHDAVPGLSSSTTASPPPLLLSSQPQPQAGAPPLQRSLSSTELRSLLDLQADCYPDWQQQQRWFFTPVHSMHIPTDLHSCLDGSSTKPAPTSSGSTLQRVLSCPVLSSVQDCMGLGPLPSSATRWSHGAQQQQEQQGSGSGLFGPPELDAEDMSHFDQLPQIQQLPM